jgi:hypothetical protein
MFCKNWPAMQTKIPKDYQIVVRLGSASVAFSVNYLYANYSRQYACRRSVNRLYNVEGSQDEEGEEDLLDLSCQPRGAVRGARERDSREGRTAGEAFFVVTAKPIHPDVTYGHKGKGYEVQLTGTWGEDNPFQQPPGTGL